MTTLTINGEIVRVDDGTITYFDDFCQLREITGCRRFSVAREFELDPERIITIRLRDGREFRGVIDRNKLGPQPTWTQTKGAYIQR